MRQYTGEEDTAGVCNLLPREASALYRNEASFRVECEDTFTALLPSWHKANTFAAITHSMETVTRMTLLPSVFFESFPVLEWSFLSALFFPSFKSPANNKRDKLSMCSWRGRNASNLSGWDSTEAWGSTYPGISIICGHVIGSENRMTVRNENWNTLSNKVVLMSKLFFWERQLSSVVRLWSKGRPGIHVSYTS